MITTTTIALTIVLVILILYYVVYVNPYTPIQGYKLSNYQELEHLNDGTAYEARMLCTNRDDCDAIVKHGNSYYIVNETDKSTLVPDKDYSTMRRRRIFGSPELMSHSKSTFMDTEVSDKVSDFNGMVNKAIGHFKLGPARGSRDGDMNPESLQRLKNTEGACGCRKEALDEVAASGGNMPSPNTSLSAPKFSPLPAGTPTPTPMETPPLTPAIFRPVPTSTAPPVQIQGNVPLYGGQFIYDTTSPIYRYWDHGGSIYGVNELPAYSASPLKF